MVALCNRADHYIFILFLSSFFFFFFLFFVYKMSREPLNGLAHKFTRKTFLVPRWDEFKGQGQRSRVKVSRDKKTTFFGPFGGLRLQAVYVW